MCQYGLTTALDMGTWPYSQTATCWSISGATDVRDSSAGGCFNSSGLSQFPGFPIDHFIPTPYAGQKFVAARVAEGVEHIKIFQDPTGPDKATVAAAAHAAHVVGKQVIAHSVLYHKYDLDTRSGVENPIHIPLDVLLNASIISALQSGNQAVSPTLYAMQAIVNMTGLYPAAYTVASQISVAAMYKAGMAIVVGSATNQLLFTPVKIPFGDLLHDELELLVQAGLSEVDAIRAATDRVATAFRIYDREVIKNGFRADSVLLGADPTTSIRNSRSIQKVWIAGVEVDVAGS